MKIGIILETKEPEKAAMWLISVPTTPTTWDKMR